MVFFSIFQIVIEITLMEFSMHIPTFPEYQKNILNDMCSFINKYTCQCSSITQSMLVTSPESYFGLTKDGRTVRWMENTQRQFSVLAGSIGMTICQPAVLTPIAQMTVLWHSYKYINPAIISGGLFLYNNINEILNNDLTENAKLAIKLTALCIASQYINPLIIDLATLVFSYCVKPALCSENAETDPSVQEQNTAEPSLAVQYVIAKCAIINAAIGLGAGVIVSGIVIPPLAGSVNLIEYLARKWRATSEDNKNAGNYNSEDKHSAENVEFIKQIREKIPSLDINDNMLLNLSESFSYDRAQKQHTQGLAKLFDLDDQSIQLIIETRMNVRMNHFY